MISLIKEHDFSYKKVNVYFFKKKFSLLEGEKMVSIKDVAKRANVSIATVSRVMNSNYSVTDKTKQNVMKAIKELNYYPNAVARSLKNDSTQTIGFLVSDISNSFFTTVAKAIEDAISPLNYNIIVCSTENRKDREISYLQMLTSKKVDGLILNPTGENNAFINLISQTIPTVLIERCIKDKDFQGDYVANDNQMAVRMLTSHLIHNNHRKIGVINGHLTLSSARERYEAFCAEMRKMGIVVDENYTYQYEGDFSMESGYIAARELMEKEDKPTALIVMNNMMMVGALKYFRQKGIRIPEDISVVNFGDVENGDILYVLPSYSTLNAELVGIKATDMLLSRIKNINLNNREVLLVSKLVMGDTTKTI
jgi:LacI family transcriptional regulator